MASRDEVYRAFGEAAELAQLLETELGTLLLAREGISQQAFVLERWESGRAVLEAINRRTLGGSLTQFRRHYHVGEDVDEVLQAALEARNRLTHGFFLSFGPKIDTPGGCGEMIAELKRIRLDLWPAYEFAGALAQALLDEAQRLHEESRTN